MSDTLAEKINKLSIRNDCAVDFNLTPEAQADEAYKNDSTTLRRFYKNYLIPEKKDLPEHLRIVSFNTFLAEPLLREGSLLLDRCLQQRREYDELKTKLFEACVQIYELKRLAIITKKEEEFYHLSTDIAQSEADALVAESTSLIGQKTKYIQQVTQAKNNVGLGDTFSNQSAQVVSGKTQIEQAQVDGAIEINTKRKAGADANVNQKKNMVKHQKLRNEVASIVAYRRAVQLETEDGALNFGEQMEPIELRMKNDLIAAYLRLTAAAIGFNKLYQYPLADFFPKDTSEVYGKTLSTGQKRIDI